MAVAYRDCEEMMVERGVEVDNLGIWVTALDAWDETARTIVLEISNV